MRGREGPTVPEPLYKLRLRGLRKTYGSVVALAGADLELREGEFLTLLGPSGSGKTTLLMAVAGLIEPDGGEVWIDQRLATFLPPFKRDVGMVFQSYALFPHLSIYENIAFPLRMRAAAEAAITREVARVLEIVQLPGVADRLPGQLSGGQQQRIALARAIVYQPSIVLMDEPLGALDKKLRDQLQLEIKHLHQRLGMTVLYVTHDQEEALVMSDRICLMNEGRIEQLGTPEELYFQPATLFAADFLGESNLLPATVAGVDGEAILVTRADGSRIRALKRADVRAGDAVRVMVRPECVHVLGDGEHADNETTGTLKEVILSGQVTKRFFTLADGSEIKSTALTGGALRLRAGEAARLGWPRARTVVLKERGP